MHRSRRFQGIANRLKKGKDQVDVILLDFSKALDTPPPPPPHTHTHTHQRLLLKLEYYGTRGQALKWNKSFLFNRFQKVVLEGCKSPKADVISGVFQGTVLDPLLFLVFINDLPEAVQSSYVRLFADDHLLYRHISSDKDSSDFKMTSQPWKSGRQGPEVIKLFHAQLN